MRTLLARFSQPEEDSVQLLHDLVAFLRPKRASYTTQAQANIESLTEEIRRNPALAKGLAQALVHVCSTTRQVSLYAQAGLLPPTGFFSETARRLFERWLPSIPDKNNLADVIGIVFDVPTDTEWVSGVSDACWLEFLLAVFKNQIPVPKSDPTLLPRSVEDALEGLRVLAYQTSAIGLRPEVVYTERALDDFESPFLALNEEIVRYLAQYRAAWAESFDSDEDERHLLVLLDQCRQIERRVHARAGRQGTSLSLTFRLARMRQHLDRMESQIHLLTTLRQKDRSTFDFSLVIQLYKRAVDALCRRNALGDYWNECIQLLSLRITENAGRTGEHYITETRREYIGLFLSAAGAGFIIAMMAAAKILITSLGLPPLLQMILVCLNYGLGFVLIHTLHFTVATKQPAMTANTIALSLGEAKTDLTKVPPEVISLSARTVRSQIAAILGNVCVAAPFAWTIGWLIESTSGQTFLSTEKATHLLTEVNPWLTGSLLYASLAGVCLFLSGLIAGFFDNLCAYNHIPERLRASPAMQRWLGERVLERFSRYISNNLGALASNFLFGVMLGWFSSVDKLLGVPLDIRHIAFSSANFGYAVQTLKFNTTWQILVSAVIGIALIGVMNLLVSFYLALNVALRSRGIVIKQHWVLHRTLLKAFLTQPRLFLFPPAAGTAENQA